MSIAIVIPARYASTRLPKKPLIKIAGKEMVLRVYDIAKKAMEGLQDCTAVVATDHQEIYDFCAEHNVPVVMTDPNCPTGSDRVCEALAQLPKMPDFVVNLQGDNPLCPPWFVRQMIDAYLQNPAETQVVTPAVHLTWEALDNLRESKKTTPFSGTTVTFDDDHFALWFSKNIIPAIQKEPKWREALPMSPNFRHIGLYGYRTDTLHRFVKLPQGRIEKIEGLEQLRFLENRIPIKIVEVDYKGRPAMNGVDSPEDRDKAERLINQYGEF